MTRFFAPVLLVLLVGSFAAQAQDVFIKPSAPAPAPAPSSGGTADLGMKARPTQQAPAPAPVPAAPQVAPEPQVSAPAPYSPPTENISTQSLPSGAEIVRVPVSKTPLPKGAGPNVLSLSIQPGSIGDSDKLIVETFLGLSASELAGNCYFEYSVVVNTGGGDMVLELNQATSARYNYSGVLKSLALFPTVACRKVKPPAGGMIIEQGGYYKVGVDSARCEFNKVVNSTVSLRYLGGGRMECKI